MRPVRRVRPEDELERVAGVADRLAALVAAGAAPAAAWWALERVGDPRDASLVVRVAMAAERGASLLPCFAGHPEAWRRVGALVDTATVTGAPLAPALRRAADGLRDAAALHRAVAAAVAGPAANARVTMGMPIVAVGLGEALGFDVLRVLLGTPIGWAALVAAALLIASAWRWTRRLANGASAAPWSAGLREDLVALGVGAGLPLAAARVRAESAAGALAVPLDPDDGVAELADFAARAGVPVRSLLVAEADRRRRAVLTTATLRAEALSARLLLPLGALVLPAFLLVGAMPIGVAILSSTTRSW